MSDMVQHKDIGSLLTARLASPFAAITAGGAGNAVAVFGGALQRSTFGLPRSAALVLAFSGTLAAGKTIALTQVQVQDSADGVNWSTYQTFTDPGAVATGPTGGGVVSGQILLRAQLSGARDWVRVGFTPTLNATGSDTATVSATAIFAGEARLPAAL